MSIILYNNQCFVRLSEAVARIFREAKQWTTVLSGNQVQRIVERIALGHRAFVENAALKRQRQQLLVNLCVCDR